MHIIASHRLPPTSVGSGSSSSAVGTAAYAYVVGFALVKIIGKFMQILPPQHALELGLDASIHGERAYKDTSNNGPALSKV